MGKVDLLGAIDETVPCIIELKVPPSPVFNKQDAAHNLQIAPDATSDLRYNVESIHIFVDEEKN